MTLFAVRTVKKLNYCSNNISSIKMKEKWIREKAATGYQKSGKLWFGLQFHHSTWFNWGPNNCSSGQQAKFVDCFSIFSPDKTKEQRIKGNAAMGYQSLGKSRFEAKHLGQQFNHSPSFNWGRKICSNGQQAKFVDCSSIFSPDNTYTWIRGKINWIVKFR